jgi:arylsulfatase A-like enzyme
VKQLFLALAALSVACGPGPSEPPAADEGSLIDAVAVARKSWSGTLIEFGSPRALPHLSEEGWSHGETARDGNTFRWASEEEAVFTFTSDYAGRHMAWIECEPFRFEGSPSQWIRLSVNGEELTEIELRPARERYPVELPLREGQNEIAMRFRYAGDPNRSSADRRRLAVAFYRFDILPEGEAPVARSLGPFAWVDDGLLLPAGGSVTLYADIPGEAQLRLTSSNGVDIVVRSQRSTLVEETLAGEDVWQRDLRANGPVEIVLSSASGTVIRPELFVRESNPPRSEPNAVDANIVLIVLDGANALRMGLYGHDKNTTPAIDALGETSVVFDNAVSQAVYTIASIGSVLTGQYPERHQSVSFADRLRDDVVTFPGLLAERGYRTAGFSGNAVASKLFGLDKGYQEYFQIWEQVDYTGHGDSVLATFRKWLDDVGDERFFAYVHFREPHFPYNPKAPFDTRFAPAEPFPEGMADAKVVEALNAGVAAGEPLDTATLARVHGLYEGNLAYVDDLVGNLLRQLDEHGRGDNTIVILTADHGEALFEHDFLGHNTQLYEESIRVPLIMKIPGAAPRRVENVVELVDLAPTILELAGIHATDMQGKSLLGPPAADRIAYSRTVWKRPRYSARTKNHKLIWDSRTGKKELYNLSADPKETTDLSEEDPFTKGYLEQKLFTWLRAQEHLRANTPPPEGVDMTEEERRRLESLGYTQAIKEK